MDSLDAGHPQAAAARQGYDPRAAAPLYDPKLMKKSAAGAGGTGKHPPPSSGGLELSAEAADAVPQEFLGA